MSLKGIRRLLYRYRNAQVELEINRDAILQRLEKETLF